ncbi:hypothetical protein AAFF_G00372260 [Aldrovandia affinis]|uniref:Calponin-homology (CH) domain-containing protein n=1 Tax=Aldrovandia affinis TaxID=143900 RepID=A0AAD7SIC0_9TELE|nr:hypothetical protein AAFF_G00372260 [Aldrovandia affinis]
MGAGAWRRKEAPTAPQPPTHPPARRHREQMEPQVEVNDVVGPVLAVAASDLTLNQAPVETSGSPEEAVTKLTGEQLATIEDEVALDKMLDETTDFEERKLIRAAMRELRKKKRDALLGVSQDDKVQRERESASRQQQKEGQKGRPGGGAAGAVLKKTEKLTDSCAHKGKGQAQPLLSSTSKTVGSIFDRQDDSASRAGGGGGLAELERRQADRRKELMKSKGSVTQARQAMIDKLGRESGGLAVTQVARVPRAPVSGVPNSKNIKQMLLDWCRAKTRAYEEVSIQNFSTSWSDGLAFCALVHNFFPHAFEYSALSPTDRKHNFETAFNTAEKLADCPPLLDVEDMVRMQEPDWKCVYTYIQEFYRSLVQKGLVKTKKSP